MTIMGINCLDTRLLRAPHIDCAMSFNEDSIQVYAKNTQRVVVIDNEPRLRDLTATILRLDFNEVQTFCDAASAWTGAFLREQKIGLLIIDARLKTVSGIQFAESLRASRKRIPIIFMTEDHVLAELLSSEYGLNSVLQKPFTAEELRSCAMRAVHKRRSSYDLFEYTADKCA